MLLVEGVVEGVVEGGLTGLALRRHTLLSSLLQKAQVEMRPTQGIL